MVRFNSQYLYTIPKKAAILIVKTYQILVSPFIASHCRFYPSCSCYAAQAIDTHGFLKGGYLTTTRLLKCHPFHPGGVDLVPDSNMNTELN